MYSVRPQHVYVHERVLHDDRAVERMQRMLAAMDLRADPEVLDDAALNDLSLERGWPEKHRWRTGQWRLGGDPIIILNAFTWEPADKIRERIERYPGLRVWLLHGGHPWTFRDGRGYYAARGTVCQNAWELHSAFGCLHRCDYCHIGEGFNIMLNLEELVARLPQLMAANPWQQLYKYDNMTDTIALEPEYGASELMVSFFARREREYLMLYTKSDNVDHLLRLEPQGHTIVSFTISSPTVAEAIEKATPDTAARCQAAARVQQAGYVPRVRFSPIIPVHGWREENEAMIRQLLEAASPDIITMDLLGWMPPADVHRVLDASLIEDRFLAAMEELFRNGSPGPAYYPSSKHIFPHELRREVYVFFLQQIRRWNKRVRVALCNETVEMWQELGPMLEMTPEEYVCGCGPTSVPGNPLLTRAAH